MERTVSRKMRQTVEQQAEGSNDWDELYGVAKKQKNPNARELIISNILMLIEFGKVIVSSLLTVIVPQNCDGHTCSIEENFTDLTEYNKLSLGWNFITLIFMIALYFVTYKREKYLIYHFDEDPHESKLNTVKIFAEHDELKQGVFYYNRLLKWSGISASVIYAVNIILSAILLFRDYYNGWQTVVQFIVNIFLCLDVLYRSISHSMATDKSNLVLSNVSFVPLYYNQIDKNYANRLRGDVVMYDGI